MEWPKVLTGSGKGVPALHSFGVRQHSPRNLFEMLHANLYSLVLI